MSSSVLADAFRVDEWNREAAADADDIGGVDSLVQSQAQVSRSSTATGRIPPWPQRRLNDALANLGPARPDSAHSAPLWSRSDWASPAETTPTSISAPDLVPDPANAAPAQAPGPRVRADIPPPPRPYRLSLGEPTDAPPSPPEQALFSWDDPVALSDVDPAGADIVRALAFVDLPPADAAIPRLFAVSHPNDRDDERERPPMIIERALAERGLGMLAVVPTARQINPVPPIAIGFSLSLIVGAALYFAMAVG